MIKAIKEVLRLIRELILAWLSIKTEELLRIKRPTDFMLELDKDRKTVITKAGGQNGSTSKEEAKIPVGIQEPKKKSGQVKLTD